ncbi:putative cardiolipin-specific deacylase, mitochondrial [Parachaetomium inaequale]|uniref:Cardiolipin-specific deacylase, mitochondrial n=1 Tax=Parachaetomium inaequale TaxID=2588326 RepID=A0AAN6PIL4_9PEZI|nr:putative cardiolipin-specific deacylase, mitochondrial [Parachaetomium inaequale]
MQHTLALLGGLGLALSGASTASKSSGNCRDVSFSLPVTSQNVRFASPPDPNDTAAIVEFMRDTWRGKAPATNGTITVADTFTITGTYCTPKNPKKAKGLQVLVHGITYNKEMWSGYGFGDPYDWHAAATARGYATLALDRLGHGANPQRPDPLAIVQPQLQLDLLAAIFKAARTKSKSNILHQAFKKVIFVGHSYGSFLGAALGAQYPTVADALVLTGYSSYLDFTDVINADWVSAAEHDPARFGAGLAKGYVTMSNPAQRAGAFFVGAFDAAIAPVDFAREDTLTVGEIGAIGAILGPAVGYKGPVLAVTGVGDVFFCETPQEKCEEHLRATAEAFPDAKSFDFFVPENTGHDLTLHYSAGKTAKRVHDWLDRKL